MGDDHNNAVDSAAFDPAKGTWRAIAEAPLSPRSGQAMVWTGTEMLVWGGRVGNTFYYDGAAYDPATDTWRRLAPAPFNAKDPVMVWTGQEAVVLGVMGDSDNPAIGEYTGGATYDPSTNEWRTLASSPVSVYARLGKVWWTGESIVAANVGIGGGQTDPVPGQLARYDLAADRWTVADIGPSSAVVGVPGSDGRASTFIDLPFETGAPVRLVDGTGRPLTELPGLPRRSGRVRRPGRGVRPVGRRRGGLRDLEDRRDRRRCSRAGLGAGPRRADVASAGCRDAVPTGRPLGGGRR